MANIETGRTFDLSEADSHFCSGHGEGCSGWHVSDCLGEISDRGVVEEAEFPYTSAFDNNDIWSSNSPHCRTQHDRGHRAIRVAARYKLSGDDLKRYISRIGPVVGTFTVYEDFYFARGVYTHVAGDAEGGHAVLVLGYSESQQAWICKNSWGASWGDSGFISIKYKDMDSDMYGVRGVSVGGWWVNWESLGGGVIGTPAVAANNDGRLELYATRGDGKVWHNWQTAPNGTWSGWATTAFESTSSVAIVRSGDGWLAAFARGPDSRLWWSAQTKPNNGWRAWAQLGNFSFLGDPVAAVNQDGRLEVFVEGSDNALWHIWETGRGTGWSHWASEGGSIAGPVAVGMNADGRLEVFARGQDGALHHIWQTAPNAGWSGWASEGGQMLFSPAVARDSDGRLEVFFANVDGTLGHIWQVKRNGAWSPWATHGSAVKGRPVVMANSDGRLEVFWRSTDGALWHIWQTHNGPWSPPTSLNGTLDGDPVVGINQDGRLEVFARGVAPSDVLHIWEISKNAGGG
jgi:hypothetical protein